MSDMYWNVFVLCFAFALIGLLLTLAHGEPESLVLTIPFILWGLPAFWHYIVLAYIAAWAAI